MKHSFLTASTLFLLLSTAANAQQTLLLRQPGVSADNIYDVNHEWTVENEGVAPDIEVKLDAIATNAGRDSQLEAAIAEVLSQLERYVDPIPDEHPAYPTELGQ